MAAAADIPAWIALFLGLYILAAAVAELRAPASWTAMLEDFEKSTALRFVTGVFTLTLGAAIYLVSPWNPGDWLSVLVSVVGGIAVAKGLFFIAAGDLLIGLGRTVMTRNPRLVAGISGVAGAALLFVALARLQAI